MKEDDSDDSTSNLNRTDISISDSNSTSTTHKLDSIMKTPTKTQAPIQPKRSSLKNPNTPNRNVKVTLPGDTTTGDTTNTPAPPAPPDHPPNPTDTSNVTTNTPTATTTTALPDMNKECRFSMIITVPPSTTPWPKYVEILRKCFKMMQTELNDNLWITGWDDESDVTDKIIKSPKDIPEGKAANRKLFSHYFSGFPNPKKNQASKVFMKVRFLMNKPETIPIDLPELGQALSEAIGDELPVHLGRNPYACQAVKTECLGWFYGSVKSIDSKVLTRKVLNALNIPKNVSLGIQWRSLKDEHRKNYAWNSEETPPQALHLDIDHNYASAYAERAGKLWKKGASKRVNGLQLRLIPCLGSARAIGLSDEQKTNCLLMSAKQQYFVNKHTTRLESSHILNLDVVVESMTLRRYLMSRAPKNEILQRLFVSVDKSWKGGTHTIITVKPYASEAQKALSYMIPECVHLYGQAAATLWFTTPGLLAYEKVKWDPNKRSTTSQNDRDTKALVEEDLFGIGTTWKLNTSILQGKPQRPSRHAKTPASPLQPVQAAIHSRTTDIDVRSFGSIYGIQPDDALTAASSPTTTGPPNVVIQFDKDLQTKELTNPQDDTSFDASSAGFTTGSTRSKLREQTKVNETLRNQMIQLNAINQQKDDDSDKTDKTTQSTRNQLAVALAALALLQEQQALSEPIDPDPVIITQTPNPSTTIDDTLLDKHAQSSEMELDPPTQPTTTAPAPATPTDIVTGNVGRQI
jgi:hypothetical protein